MNQGVIKNLKLNYRWRLLNRGLLCVDSNNGYVVDVLSCPIGYQHLSDAWREVTQETIRDCFRNVRFVVGCEDGASDTVQKPTAEMPPAAVSDICHDLRARGVDVAAATFEDFTNVASAVRPGAELDDDEIICQVPETAQVGSDSDDDVPTTPGAPNSHLARALTIILCACRDEQTLAEIQADIVAHRRAFFPAVGPMKVFFFSESPFRTPDYADLSAIPVQSEKTVVV
ncbi:hypothetical protein HPB48_023005 [Haemaphysalis longicornis]|uniref:Uncharacterized protein n=1 Tax=Haemaphysalis longicornis TaxID=44386 RepID=A0A9J6FMQ8_HAELO|nr:hypothetical protein HPB48_023005 [Haemaphysalis longicornis]